MFNMSFFSLCMTLPFCSLPPHLPATALRYLSTLLPFALPMVEGGTSGGGYSRLLSSHEKSSPLVESVHFISTHPTSFLPIIQYALLGGVGQLFIFETIQHFGSLTLVMLTVTRKLVTMLLSVLVFGHKLTGGQWAGVGVVFAGVGLEAGMKRKGGSHNWEMAIFYGWTVLTRSTSLIEIMDKKIANEQRKSRLKAM